METIFEAGIDWKTTGRNIRRFTATGGSTPATSTDDAGEERPLFLSQRDAMHLLTLCAASPVSLEHGEEALLFAKMSEYLRRF